MEKGLIIEIQTYLKAIGELNSAFTGSDAWYMLGFGVLTKKSCLFISEKISLFDDTYQKFYIKNDNNVSSFVGDMVEIGNWEEELTRTCNEWFYQGAYILNCRTAIMANPIIKDFQDINNRVKDTIGNRLFPTKSFIKLMKELFENNLIGTYVPKNLLQKKAHNTFDEFTFICKENVYVLRFEITD